MEMSILIPMASLFLLGLLFFEKKANTKGILFTKPVVSLLFVITAAVQHPVSSNYYYTILVALMLCLVGDVCLIFQDSNKMFLAGLISFLVGHVVYVAAFLPFARIGITTWGALLFFCVFGAFIFLWLLSGLGPMKIPVCAYILIITAMVTCAVSLFGNANLTSVGRYLVLVGALSFYFSDIFVARNQFVIDAYVNRLIGLPLYYIGQFLLACSTAHVG